jgi:hypothetical protein
MSKRIVVTPVIRGEVVSMKDKNPTGGYPRHNYLVISEITETTKEVVCAGITSCKHGKWDNVIPFTSSNGVEAYINLNTFYTFLPSEFAGGNGHGYVRDQDFLDFLQLVYLSHMGLLSSNPIIEKQLQTALSEWVVSVDNSTETETKTTSVDTPNLGAAVESEKTKKSKTKGKYGILTPIPVKPGRVIYPRFTTSWSDEQLQQFKKEVDAKDWDAAAQHMGTSKPTIRLLEKRIAEVERVIALRKEGKDEGRHRRAPQKSTSTSSDVKQPETKLVFSENCKKYSCKFWSNDEIGAFLKLYRTEAGKSTLMSEFKLTQAGLIKRHGEVETSAKARNLAMSNSQE